MKPTSPSPRAWPLDFLRIAATFSVIVLHAIPLSRMDGVLGTPAWCAMNVLSSLCLWNVPVFFMISGALFLSPHRPVSTRRLYTKTLPRMLASFLFFAAVYAAVYCVRTGTGLWAFLIQTARGHYHMWYILKIIGLYALTPLLRPITQSKRATEYLLLLGFVFSFLLAQAVDALSLLPLPHADFFSSIQYTYAQLNPYKGLYYVYYYVLGHYLFAYPPRGMLRRFILLCGAVGAFLVIALTQWHSRRLGSLSTQFSAHTSCLILAMSAAVFVGFMCLFEHFRPSERTGRILLHLSARAYGVYLVHALLLECFPLPLPASALGGAAGVLLYALLLYLLADGISALLARIPLLGRYIV